MNEIKAYPELVAEVLTHLDTLEKNGFVIAVGGFDYHDVWVRIIARPEAVSVFMLASFSQIRGEVNWGKMMPSFCWELFDFATYGLSKQQIAQEIAQVNTDGMDWRRPRIDYMREAASNGGGIVPLFHRLWGKISYLMTPRLETPCSSRFWKPYARSGR